MTTPFDLTQTDHLLTTTRAVRKRLDMARPVEPEVLVECIQIATQAPSGSNSQRWRWVLVTDPDKKMRISIIANYYDQFVRENGRWKFKRHQIGGTPPASPSGSK